MTFEEWQAKHGPNGGAYDIEMQRAGWNGAMAQQTGEAVALTDMSGYHAALHAANELKERGRYVDDEGEPTDAILDFLAAVRRVSSGGAIKERDANKADAERYRDLRDQMTFYNTAESDGPVLACVSKRIWYHATDCMEYPLDAAVDAIAARTQETP